MTIGQGARAQLLHKPQSVLGTPATGNFSVLPFITHSLKIDKGTVEDPTQRSDRQVSDYRHTTKGWSGDVEVALRDVDYDTLIASMMFNTFLTDTITIGTTPQYITFEDGQLDIAQYSFFVDGLVSQGRFSFKPDDIARATFSLVGTTPTQAGVTAGGTPVAATTRKPFDSLSAALFDNRAETGAELAVVTSLDFTVDNGAKAIYALGSPNAVAIEYGRARVTGTLTAYYENATWIDRFLNETEAALIWNITDPDSNSWEFRMDRIKVNNADKPWQNEQSRIITCSFMALLPEVGSNTTLKITRN